MRPLLFLGTLLCPFALLAADASAPAASPPVISAPAASPIDFDSLGLGANFRSEAYLEAAATLQAMPRDQAFAQLRARAGLQSPVVHSSAHQYHHEVMILCRMLFEAPAGKTFRHPQGLSHVTYIDSSTHQPVTESSPPVELITLVDGIPFLFSTTQFAHWGSMMMGNGSQEGAWSYLEYCIETMQWSSHPYRPATPATRQAALDKLLASEPWTFPHPPVNAEDATARTETIAAIKAGLAAQITDTPPLLDLHVMIENESYNSNLSSSSGLDFNGPAAVRRVSQGLSLQLGSGMPPFHFALQWSNQPAPQTLDTPDLMVCLWFEPKPGPPNSAPPFPSKYPYSFFTGIRPPSGTALNVIVTDKLGSSVSQAFVFRDNDLVEIHRPVANPVWPAPKP